MYCIEFPNNYVPASLYGSKANALNKASAFASVPKGFVVGVTAYDDFVAQNDLGGDIQRHLASFCQGDLSADECSMRIQDAFLCGTFTDRFREELLCMITQYSPPLVARSSSTVEDSPSLSFAGLFDSYLNVDPDDVEAAIRKVFASVFNSRLLEYSRKHGRYPGDIKMAVMIQEMLQGDKFGVGFGLMDPNGGKVVVIESVINDPAGVTAGKTTPDTYIWRDGSRYGYPALINRNSLFEFESADIVRLVQKAEQEFSPVDIEWGIAAGDLYLLQARPLTRDIPIPQGTEGFAGLPASHGIVCGEAVIWDGHTSLLGDKKKILLAEEIEISDVDVVKNYGGLVLEISGITAHAAILAREYALPCVVGVNGITKLVRQGEKILIDGTTGEISLPERKGFSIKRRYFPVYIDPRRLECFRFGDETLLVYPEKSHVLLYHPSLDEELRSISAFARRRYKRTVIDGGVDIWYGYNTILEMGLRNGKLRQDFLRAVNVTEGLNLAGIDATARELIHIGMGHCEQAKVQLERHAIHGQRSSLAEAFEEAELAFAYWRIVQFSMMYDFAENVAHRNSDSDLLSEFQNFATGFQDDRELVELGTAAMGLIESISAIMKNRFGIDDSEISSLEAVIERITRFDP